MFVPSGTHLLLTQLHGNLVKEEHDLFRLLCMGGTSNGLRRFGLHFLKIDKRLNQQFLDA